MRYEILTYRRNSILNIKKIKNIHTSPSFQCHSVSALETHARKVGDLKDEPTSHTRERFLFFKYIQWGYNVSLDYSCASEHGERRVVEFSQFPSLFDATPFFVIHGQDRQRTKSRIKEGPACFN